MKQSRVVEERSSTSSRQNRPAEAIQVFIFQNDQFLGTELFDGQSPVIIGRHRDADLRLDGETVSREHCRLIELNGDIAVEDLGSGNGTLVNRRRVQGRMVLRARDQLWVGSYVLRVRWLSSTPRREPAVDGWEETTKIQAILTAERTGESDELGIEMTDMFDHSLYEAALRRTTGSEPLTPATPLPAAPRGPSLVATDIGGDSTQTSADELSLDERRRARSSRLDPDVQERLRDLDDLIAALDAREKGQEPPVVPWRVDNDTLDRFEKPARPSAKVIPFQRPDSLQDPEDVGSETEVMERDAPVHAATIQVTDEQLEDVWTQSPEPDPPAKSVETQKASLPSSELQTDAKVAALPSASSAKDFDGVEITARCNGLVMDIAVLRHEGDQYILGYRTPQGVIAPVRSHQGLRLVRINQDRTVHLIFPAEVSGSLVRGSTKVDLRSLAEGRKFSCLQLEARDEVDAVLGPADDAITYRIRFLKRPSALFRSLRGRRGRTDT